MQTFVWSPRFETGIADTDGQHRRLVDLINGQGSRFRVCLPLMPAVDPVVLVPAVGSVLSIEKEEGA